MMTTTIVIAIAAGLHRTVITSIKSGICYVKKLRVWAEQGIHQQQLPPLGCLSHFGRPRTPAYTSPSQIALLQEAQAQGAYDFGGAALGSCLVAWWLSQKVAWKH
jgi:hypothetical protein